ncbi:thiamine phosphate synthase [Pyruvatibacter sp.]|uniref:thiamine phosphate synthase n=1 Tax=Pyruvatibacter sp. TaxID=1981328 RepID=UPI0032EC91E6
MTPDSKAALAASARVCTRTFGPRGPHAWPSLMVMTDHAQQGDATHLMDALPAGTLVCLRDYDHPARPDLALALSAKAKAKRLRLLIGKDPWLALAVGAWGVHMPEGLWRMSARGISAARARGLRVTVSAHSVRAARSAINGPAGACDALVVSPVFETQSHPGRKPMGALGFQRICNSAGTQGRSIPAYALGGMNAQTIAGLKGTHAWGACGIRFTA